jgi:hypothetical protein
MSTRFGMIRDINGYNGFGLIFADDKYNTTLAAGVAQTLTIPSNAAKWLAILAYEPGGTVWVANNATAALPGGSMASATSELNPTARLVKAGDVLSFITSDTTLGIGITLYILE